MKIILKHILKNIWEKKGRSLLIILSLIIATTFFVNNLILPKEIVLKTQETLRSVYGELDIEIKTVEPFTINNLNMGDEKINYVGISQLQVALGGNEGIIYGTDIEKAKETKMLGSDIPNLNKNEVVISTKQAEKNNYKEGDLITVLVEGTSYELKIVKITSEKGLTTLDMKFPFFISNLETINEIRKLEDEKFDAIYIDVKNNDKVKSFAEYIRDNNENYLVEELVDVEAIEDQTSFISYIMILIFVMATIMIFFVVNSLNKVIVAERMPVIGTFRSIGATKGKMNLILILENIIYGLIGGIIGSLLGYGINNKVVSLFIKTNGVELSDKTTQMTAGTILIGIVFAVLLEFIISISAILKSNKRPIKEIIFDIQSTRYAIRKSSVILGILMVTLSLCINYYNVKMNILLTIIALIFLIVGVASITPFIIRGISGFFTTIFKKVGWSTGIIASKNIGYNKMIISSSRLIVIALSLMITISIASDSFTNLFNSFRYITGDFDIIIRKTTKKTEEYNKLLKMDSIEDIEYMYYFYDNYTTYNDEEKFKTTPIIIGQEKTTKYIKEIDYKVEDLKYNEILIDEKLAERNNINVNDTISIKFRTINKDFDFKVVGLVNSTYFTTSRNVIVINFQNYIDNISHVPMQVHLKAEEGVDLEKLKVEVYDELKEVGLEVQTISEYLNKQEEQSNSIMSLFYVIIGLAVVLSFIGIVNNQVISFMQRKKELAVLNSTCMSKKQINKMLIAETVLANIISCIFAIAVGFLAKGIIDSFMQGLALYVDVIFNFDKTIKFVGIIFIILLLTLIIPSRKLNKINVVNEIKYE